MAYPTVYGSTLAPATKYRGRRVKFSEEAELKYLQSIVANIAEDRRRRGIPEGGRRIIRDDSTLYNETLSRERNES